MSLVFPMIVMSLEHVVYLKTREDQSWPTHLSRREIDLGHEVAHAALFHRTFRIRVEIFEPLLRGLQVPQHMWTRAKKPEKFTGVTGLLVLLARLGCTGAGHIVGRMLRMRPKRISAICLSMVRFLVGKWGHVIKDGLITSRLPLYAEAVRKCAGIVALDIFSFADCTVRGCSRPLYGQEAIYGGHKKKHGFKYQGLALPDGIMACLFGPKACRRHDSTLLADSDLLKRIEAQQIEDGREWLIYGDPAYTLGKPS